MYVLCLVRPRHGPVDEVQVKVVKLEIRQCLTTARLHIGRCVVGLPDFAGDVYVRPRCGAGGEEVLDASAHL